MEEGQLAEIGGWIFLEDFARASYVVDKPRPNPSHVSPCIQAKVKLARIL